MKSKKISENILKGIISLLICFLVLIIIFLHLEINLTVKKALVCLFLIGLFICIILFIKLVKIISSENDKKKFKKFTTLINSINEDSSFEGVLNHMYHSFQEYIPYSHIGIALLKDDGKTIEASFGYSDSKINLAKKLIGINANLIETSLARIIKTGEPRVINDLPVYIKKPKTIYNKIILEAGINSSITFPLKLYNKPVGIIFFSSVYKNIYNKHHISFLKILSNSMAISLYKNLYIDELLYTQVLTLAKLAEARDEDTGMHLERMKKYSLTIAELLYKDNIFPELSIKLIKDIEKFSPLHDIGKVGIRDSILLKPGKLTESEFKEMQTHVEYGAKVLIAAEQNMCKFNKSIFKVGIDIVLGHHEKWDGTGYPNQKKGDDIPLSARIVAVADVFDALTSKRPYKKAFSFEYAFEVIIQGKAKHFDPRIVNCLIKHKEEIYHMFNKFHNK